MRKVALYVFLIFLMASVIGSCHQSHKKELDDAYVLAESNPDSAIAYLNHIDKGKLSEGDMAKYALVYYMAQDKSGLDVDNDSLIRVAYNWYEKHQEDSLYAKSLYYMGKCYMLMDSMEQAKNCLEFSCEIADSINDIKTKFLAIDKLVEVEELLDPYKALRYAQTLVSLDSAMQNSSANRIAAHLRLCENLLYVDSMQKALDEGKMVLGIAKKMNNKAMLPAIYQDLSLVFGELGEKDSCLAYAKQACCMGNADNFSCLLNLASAYMAKDSIKQTFKILNSVKPKTAEDRYSVFYMQSQASIKVFDSKSAKIYSDSAYNCLEELYRTSLQDKATYYSSSLQEEKDKAVMMGKTIMLQWVLGLTILLFVVILSFILFVYVSYRKQTKLKQIQEKQILESQLRHEQALHEQEQEMKEKLHQEELMHKEVQLSVMRNYLQKKIEIVEKLESICHNQVKHFVLSENDWAELEVFLDSVEDLFVTRKHQTRPTLSESDLRLMMLLRLKLSQKALASIYCISEKAIKQKLFLYKEKVGIQNEHFSLRNYIENF